MNGVHRWDGGIAPAVIQDELASAFMKTLEIRIRRVKCGGRLLVGGFQIAVDIESVKIPLRVVIDHVAEELGSEGELKALGRRPAGDPQSPAAGSCFATGGESGHDLVALGILRTSVDFLECCNLRRGEAGIGLRPFAK